MGGANWWYSALQVGCWESINTGPGTQGPEDPITPSLEGCVALHVAVEIQLYRLSVPVLHA